MQQMTGVAVLATHLAETDRRTLSQAWYDALHLAGTTTPQRPVSVPSRSAGFAPSTPPSVGENRSGLRSGDGGNPLAARSHHPSRHDGAFVAERRAPKSDLARRIERALARRTSRGPSTPASFAVNAAGGRVQILVRSEGERMRVVAVCAPPLRERVERALAQARFVLASRGIRAEAG
ncbi:MAG TPA: hypothetical protein VE591_09375 [Candidatus Acidoferrum sp.]|nr:hypothetical protein [Candidatus Acidoferrum sp.]